MYSVSWEHISPCPIRGSSDPWPYLIWEAETNWVCGADEELRRNGQPISEVGVDALLEAGQRDEALDEAARQGQAGRGQHRPPQPHLVDD